MAWAQEMKNLVGDIRTSTRERRAYVKDQKKATQDLLADFDRLLREMARDLKEFLGKSEADRKKDFNAMTEANRERIKEIQSRVRELSRDSHELLERFDKELKEMAGDLKEFLGKSEDSRMADFRAMMKDIEEAIADAQKRTREVLGDAQGLVRGYKGERKEAASYWKGLLHHAPVEAEAGVEVREAAEAVHHEAPKPKAKKRRRKKK